MEFIYGGPYQPPGPDVVRTIAITETTLTRRGRGVEGDPIRIVTQYWSIDGQFLAEHDPFQNL